MVGKDRFEVANVGATKQDADLTNYTIVADVDKVNLEAGADVMNLETLGSKVMAGEVSSEFQPAER